MPLGPTAPVRGRFFISGKELTKIKIDSQDYDFDLLAEDSKAQLVSIQFIDQELAKLRAQIAVLQTARNADSQVLRSILQPASEKVQIS